MLDEPFVKTLPPIETKIEHLIARVPALEVNLDTPTIDEVHANDEVFRHNHNDSDNLMGMIGMVSGMMMLHDVAVETVQDVSDLEGHLQRDESEDDDDDDDDDEE